MNANKPLNEESFSMGDEELIEPEQTDHSRLLDKKIELEREIEELRRYQVRLGSPEKNHSDNDVWNKFEETIVGKMAELEQVITEIKTSDKNDTGAVA